MIAAAGFALEAVDKGLLAYDVYRLQQAVADGDDELAADIGADLAIAGGTEIVIGIVPGSILGTKLAQKILDKVDTDKAMKLVGQLETPRTILIRSAENPKLKEAIDNLYRPNAKVGSGSTMDAVRYERETGILLSPKGHTQKLIDRRTQLVKLKNSGTLNPSDQKIVNDLLIDIQDALK